jgi:hypothetical protein
MLAKCQAHGLKSCSEPNTRSENTETRLGLGVAVVVGYSSNKY